MSDYASLVLPQAQKNSQQVAMTTASAQTTTLGGGDCIVTVTAFAFVERGANPTATSDGKSVALAPNIPYRLRGVQPGEKLAFIVPTGTGTAYVTEGS